MFEQLTPGASGLLQFVFIRLYELAPDPVMVVVPVKVIDDDVLFFNVITCVAALDPTVVEANVIDPGVMVSPVLALAPVPVNATVWAEDDAESK